MLEVADALATVLKHAEPLQPEIVSLTPAALGQVLAADVVADADSPPFAKSLRDGYAVRSADCASPDAELRVIEEVPAGTLPAKSVGAGEATRIFTGAPLPDGADAVVMQEHTQPLDGGRVRITDTDVKPRQHVYARGTEMKAGAVVVSKGTPLNPAAFGVLASVGRTAVPVFPRPRVGIVATGDELVEADTTPKAGQIRNSNGPMLTALTVRGGGLPRYLGIARDDRAATKSLIAEGIDASDVVLIAGGVSVGDYDLVPDVLKELGVTIHFRQDSREAGQAAAVRHHGNGRAGVRAAGQPGEFVRRLRVVRATRDPHSGWTFGGRSAHNPAPAGRRAGREQRPADVPPGETGAGRSGLERAPAAVFRVAGPRRTATGRRAARAAGRRHPRRPRH